jgi:hypothetical protein
VFLGRGRALGGLGFHGGHYRGVSMLIFENFSVFLGLWKAVRWNGRPSSRMTGKVQILGT